MPKASEYGQIDFRTQIIMLLPPILRTERWVDWLSSLVVTLDTILDEDWDFIYDQYAKAFMTGQKMVMQGGLNFLFRITFAPFILIETARNEGATLYMFNEVEATDTFMYNEAELVTVYMLNEAEAVQPSGVDFFVKMPTIYASVGNLARLDTQVRLLKPTGRTFTIVTY